MRAIFRIAIIPIWAQRRFWPTVGIPGRGRSKRLAALGTVDRENAFWYHPRLKFPQWSQALQIIVRDNNIDQALKALKKKMQREGIFREMKLRKSYEKPSERKAREKAEAVRRARKMERKRLEREGF